MEKCVIALDLGTTGNRAIAFDRNCRIIASSYYELPVNFPKPAWVEQDPFDILNTAVKALNDVINEANGYDILSIGITNQRETTILWNKNTGKPLYNAISWQCRRTKQICDNLSQYSGLIKEKTGLFLDPYFSATKIKWIIDNVAGAKEAIDNRDVLFGTVDAWVLWNLTGGEIHATDSSNASRTLLFNINTLKYDDDLLKIFDIPENILPEVKNSNAFFGITDKNVTGVQIPVAGILGDQQASLFAHGGGDGIIKNTYGTGLFVMTQVGNKPVNSEKLISTVAWTLGRETFYALEGSIFIGGAVIKWLKDGLSLINSEKDSDLMAKKLKSNEGVYFVPALSGLGAPYWDSDARGLIIGITGGTTANHIIRAALESLCYQTKDIILEFFTHKDNINKKTALGDAGINEISYNDQLFEHYKLRVDGKASENDFLMQFQSDILNMKVERTTFAEMTALGVAGIAGISSGLWSLNDFLNNYRIEKTYTPNMNEKERDFYYLQWKEALARALKWIHY